MDNNRRNITDEDIAAFLDGNVSGQEMAEIISAMSADGEVAEILSVSSAVDHDLKEQECRIIPMHALAAANPENLCSFDCETFIMQRHDMDMDRWSLLETAKANNWLREEGTPLHHVGRLLELKGMHVDRRYDASVRDIETALGNGLEIMAVIDGSILNDKEPDEHSPAHHAIYLTGIDDESVDYLDLDTLEEESIEIRDFLDAWKCSGNYMVTVSAESDGYDPQPISVEDIDLDADLMDLTEAIAENAHDIWARARMDEGWTYGPVRDDSLKQHPDLVPYSRLPESEKEYDRLMAMNTLRLVRRLGSSLTTLND